MGVINPIKKYELFLYNKIYKMREDNIKINGLKFRNIILNHFKSF